MGDPKAPLRINLVPPGRFGVDLGRFRLDLDRFGVDLGRDFEVFGGHHRKGRAGSFHEQVAGFSGRGVGVGLRFLYELPVL